MGYTSYTEDIHENIADNLSQNGRGASKPKIETSNNRKYILSSCEKIQTCAKELQKVLGTPEKYQLKSDEPQFIISEVAKIQKIYEEILAANEHSTLKLEELQTYIQTLEHQLRSKTEEIYRKSQHLEKQLAKIRDKDLEIKNLKRDIDKKDLLIWSLSNDEERDAIRKQKLNNKDTTTVRQIVRSSP